MTPVPVKEWKKPIVLCLSLQFNIENIRARTGKYGKLSAIILLLTQKNCVIELEKIVLLSKVDTSRSVNIKKK